MLLDLGICGYLYFGCQWGSLGVARGGRPLGNQRVALFTQPIMSGGTILLSNAQLGKNLNKQYTFIVCVCVSMCTHTQLRIY